TAEEAYAHFVMHGQFEVRPGKPENVVTPVPGDTFTLTTGNDHFSPTSAEQFRSTDGNDLFRAPLDGTSMTLQTADYIDGGLGTDTLAATLRGGTVTPVLRSVEILKLTSDGGGTSTFVGSDSTGIQEIWNMTSPDTLIVNG